MLELRPSTVPAIFLVIKPDFPLVVAALWYPDEVARPVLNYPRTWLKLVA